MADTASSADMMDRPNFLCPEILHPGQTGCKYVDVVDRLERVEKVANGHTETLIKVEAYGSATVFWAKVIASLIAILGVAAAIYFGSLEARARAVGILHPKIIVAAPSNPEYAHNRNLPQDAGNQAAYLYRSK